MANQNFLVGVKTQILFGILPSEILQLDELAPPPDVTITLSAAASAGATSLAVTALTGPVAIGTPLKFAPVTVITLTAASAVGDTTLDVDALTRALPAGAKIVFPGVTAKLTAGAAIGATSLQVRALTAALTSGATGNYTDPKGKLAYTTAHALTGDTAISVAPLKEAIPNATVCAHQGLLLLQGGKTSDEQINNKDTQSIVYSADGLGYADGLITGADWKISYSTNYLPIDPGYQRLRYAAENAIGGVRGYVRKIDPAPEGATVGNSIEGLVDLGTFSVSNPAENIMEVKTDFIGRGSPITNAYS